MERLCNGFR